MKKKCILQTFFHICKNKINTKHRTLFKNKASQQTNTKIQNYNNRSFFFSFFSFCFCILLCGAVSMYGKQRPSKTVDGAGVKSQ